MAAMGLGLLLLLNPIGTGIGYFCWPWLTQQMETAGPLLFCGIVVLRVLFWILWGFCLGIVNPMALLCGLILTDTVELVKEQTDAEGGRNMVRIIYKAAVLGQVHLWQRLTELCLPLPLQALIEREGVAD